MNPEEIGIKRAASLEGLEGGTPVDNARVIQRVIEGEHGPARDIILLNAAAALVITDLADDLAEGADMARASIDEGKTAEVLDSLVKLTTEAASA